MIERLHTILSPKQIQLKNSYKVYCYGDVQKGKVVEIYTDIKKLKK